MFIQTVLAYRFSIEHSETDIRAISVLNIPVIYKYIILIILLPQSHYQSHYREYG